MGALTSKPFAFRARPWEAKSIEFFDIFTTLYQPLYYDVRGHSILRITPRNNSLITDQARFFYDSILMESRLLTYNDGSLSSKYHEHKMGMNYLRSLCLKHFTVYRLFAGRFIDTLESKAINEFSTSVGNTFIIGDHYDVSLDIPSDIFGSNLTSLQIFQSILLIFTNIRLEAPLIALQIQNHPNVYNFGDFTYSFFANLQVSTHNKFNINFILGKHSIWKFLLQYNSCLIIVGSRFLQISKKTFNITASIMQFIHQLSKISFEGIYTSLSLLPSLTTLNLNILIPFFPFNAFITTLFLGAEAITSSQRFSNFYRGSHFDNGARASILVWPGFTLMERKVSQVSFSNGISYKNFQILPSSIKATNSTFSLFLFRTLLGVDSQPTTYNDFVFSKAHTSDDFFFDMNNYKLFVDPFHIVSQIAIWNLYEATIYHRQSVTLSIASRRFSEIIGNNLFKKI